MKASRSNSIRSGKRRQVAKRKLKLESLEGRSLLAGDVLVAISGTDIQVTGDGDANEIEILADAAEAGRFTITGLNGTAINGTPDDSVVVEGFNLRVTMQAGDDIVTMIGDGGAGSVMPGGVYVDLGTSDGLDQLFSLSGGYRVTAGLRVIASAGFETISIDETTARDMFFSTGSGGETINITNSQTTSGGIAVTTGVQGAGGEPHTIAMDNVDVAKHVDLILGAGDTDISLQDVIVAGNLNIRTQTGTDTINIGMSSAVQVTGDVYISTGAGAADIDMLEGSARFLTIKTGSGLADINIATYEIDHSLLITNGNGAGPDVITLDGLTVGAQNDGRTMGKDISIVGAASTTLSLTNSTVQGFINVQTMTGTQDFTLDGVQVNGSISVRNGVTGNVIFNGSNLDVGNTFALITGRGMHEINLGQAGPVSTARGLAIRSDGGAVVTMDDTSVGLDLSVTLGNTNGLSQMFIGTSLPLFISRNASFRTGIGDSEIVLGALDIGGSLMVQSRSGDDLWTIGGISGVGDLIVGRFTTLSTGLGTDDVQLGTDAGAISYFTGAFSLNLGPGDDSVTVGEGVTGDAFSPPYNFVFEGNLGDNSITVTGAVAFDPFDPAIRKRLRNFGTNIFT